MKDYLIEKYLGEARELTVDGFVGQLESTIKKIFPKSYVSVRATKNLGSAIDVTFALGKDKSEFTNGIIQNDPLLHKFTIGWNSFSEGRFIKDKIEAELIQGGSLKVNPEEGSYLAFGSVKIGWRKKTSTPDQMVKYMGDYFKKVKKVLTDNWDRMPERDRELLKNKK